VYIVNSFRPICPIIGGGGDNRCTTQIHELGTPEILVWAIDRGANCGFRLGAVPKVISAFRANSVTLCPHKCELNLVPVKGFFDANTWIRGVAALSTLPFMDAQHMYHLL